MIHTNDPIRQLMLDFYPSIKEVIYNNPATIINWTDGSKTVVYCTDNYDMVPVKVNGRVKYDRHHNPVMRRRYKESDGYIEWVGFLLCIAKKAFGNNEEYRKVIKHFSPDFYNQPVVPKNFKDTVTEAITNGINKVLTKPEEPAANKEPEVKPEPVPAVNPVSETKPEVNEPVVVKPETAESSVAEPEPVVIEEPFPLDIPKVYEEPKPIEPVMETPIVPAAPDPAYTEPVFVDLDDEELIFIKDEQPKTEVFFDDLKPAVPGDDFDVKVPDDDDFPDAPKRQIGQPFIADIDDEEPVAVPPVENDIYPTLSPSERIQKFVFQSI